MEGYTQSEYHIFTEEDEDEEEENPLQKSKVKYTVLLTEDEFLEDD